MESILEIADLVINCCYSSAVDRIGSAISDGSLSDDQKQRLHFYRAICHSELGDFNNAMKDLDACEAAFGKTGHWNFRYGQALFMTDDFSNALISLKKAEESEDIKDSGLKQNIKNWVNKTLIEMGNVRVGNINESIFMKDEAPMTQEDAKQKTEETPVSQTSEAITEATSVKQFDQIDHDWYQNNDYVFLSVLKKKYKGQCSVVISDDRVNVTFPSGDGFQANLGHQVDSSGSSYTQGEKKVEIKLKKMESGIFWNALLKEKAAEAPKEVLPSYPTSNKNKKNWDSLDKEFEKEILKDKKEGDDAMNDLFKQIYAGADEETRRAMIKSYQTSNGTVLSTNWGEVKEKDYEGKDYVSPPDHFEPKKPEY